MPIPISSLLNPSPPRSPSPMQFLNPIRHQPASNSGEAQDSFVKATQPAMASSSLYASGKRKRVISASDSESESDVKTAVAPRVSKLQELAAKRKAEKTEADAAQKMDNLYSTVLISPNDQKDFLHLMDLIYTVHIQKTKTAQAKFFTEIKNLCAKNHPPDFLNLAQDSKSKMTPLLAAASVNNPELVYFFLKQKGIDPNISGPNGLRPTMMPEPKEKQYFNTLRVFLNEPGIKWHATDSRGMTAADHANDHLNDYETFDSGTAKSKLTKDGQHLKEIVEQMKTLENQRKKQKLR